MQFLMHQGDQYSIILKIEANGLPIALDNIELIEFTIGPITQVYPTEVLYNEEFTEFYFPVTQEHTFMMDGMEKYQVRIKYTNGSVVATPVQMLDVNQSLSKNII